MACTDTPACAIAAPPISAQPAPDGMCQLEAFIQREIDARMHRGWKQLELCFKWKLINDFLRARPADGGESIGTSERNELRAMLRRNELTDVEYDGVRILRLNALSM